MTLSRIFVCRDCGQTISRSVYPTGIEPERNTCTICHWINTNTRLSPKEREELRKKLCKPGLYEEPK